MTAEKDKTVCFTGHRQIPDGEKEALRARLDAVIEGLIAQGFDRFAAGGALGFDTMAEQAVLRAREKHPHIRLVLILPFPEHGRRWSEENRRTHDELRARADEVEYAMDHYTRYCMFQRNRRLVECAAVCVAYQTEDTGGTAYTVKYARSKGLGIINLADE